MDQLVILSDTKFPTGQSVIIEDYNQHPALCRSGIWIGLLKTFVETVKVAYEHTEDLYVGWAINGVTVVDPGYSNGTLPPGQPCPGAPSVLFNCPVDGFFHEISFTSTSGDPHECLAVQVLYRLPTDEYKPAHQGPTVVICLAGSEIDWPANLLAAWEACLASLWSRISKIKLVAHVNPGDPVEFLGTLSPEQGVLLQTGVQTLEQLDAAAQPELANAIRARLSGILSARPFAQKAFNQREDRAWRKRRHVHGSCCQEK